MARPTSTELGERMTAEQFEQCRKICGWSYCEVARRLGVNEVQVRRWATGKRPIPTPAADWIHAVALYLVHHPAPSGRQRPSHASAQLAQSRGV